MERKIPEFLYDMLEKEYEENNTKKIIKGFNSKRKTTLRVNNIKSNLDEVEKQLVLNGFNITRCENIKDAIIIEKEGDKDLRSLDIYKEGKIYIQSLSSMLPALFIMPNENENILDMAAAPGSKTTQMYNLSCAKAFITACEKNKIRADRLKYNLDKQGAGKVSVLVQDARKLDEFMSFDKILLDSPCSGTGTILLNDENTYKNITKELIDRSSKTQKELITKAIKLLKRGSELVYSTCSLLKEENEDVINYALSKGNVEIIDINLDGIDTLRTNIKGTICVLPTEEYEGFFIAKLKKK